ncbi:MAG TPA: FCD domain-containing protein [Caulobacteraceae bacterium]|jgi:DNA-binding FadR family transcriptional regulator|nr:FCD domain-containing protein [Caulobacteraceae bacterium]
MSGLGAVRTGGSLVRTAIDAIAAHIGDNGLRVGDALPGEGEFAQRLGVSRAVIREAYGALAAVGRIDVANGRRAKVAAMDGSAMANTLDHAVATAQVTVPQVWDVRRTLEVRTAALAAQFRSDAQAAELLGIAGAMSSAVDDLAAVTNLDIAFHRLIAQASGNALFAQIVGSFEHLMEVAVPTAWRTRETPWQRASILERHGDIARAIARRDPAAAARGMEGHFDQAVGDILAAD